MDFQNFIDAEYCIDKYFEKHLAKRLDFYIDSRNAAVVSGRSTGFGLTNALAPSEDYATSVKLNVPAKDIEKLGAEMARDKQLNHDIEVLAKAWRTAAVAQVGEERYKQLSDKLGGDLAMAYVNHRLTMRMVDYEVAKTPIKGSVDYILDEARRSSLLSFLSAPTTELQQYIDKKIVERYNPGLLEKGAGKALGSLTDLTLTLPVTGVSSFAGLSKFVAVDLGLGLAGDALIGKSGQQLDVSQMVSAALFSSDTDVLSEVRKETSGVNPYSSEVVKAIDSQLGKKIVHHSTSLFDAKGLKPTFGLKAAKLPEIPDYAGELRRAGEMHFAIREHFDNQEVTNESEQKRNISQDAQPAAQSIQQQYAEHLRCPVNRDFGVSQGAFTAEQKSNFSVSGWGGIFDSLGLNGFSDVGKNFGYVLAMLPDMLVGMFTGKSRNLKFGDNMMPIAAIFAGMFVRNPLLKMLLVGLGGANLLNKAGHEALENRDGMKSQPIRQYRKYDDEPLDLRVSQPVMKGNTLVVTIDHIPSVITINDEAVDAYYKGALPLNTLTNAVLRKYDEQQQALQESYDRQVKDDESLELSRGGIK